tara:strand:+ start:46204 stop:47211 length:1008 start_codon:yes stop_codon:yes gene_type:complete
MKRPIKKVNPRIKKELLRLILALLVIVLTVSCNSRSSLSTPSLGNSPSQPELFWEGFISTQYYERDIAISKTGNEIIYTLGDYKQTKRALVSTKLLNGEWSAPEILGFSGEYQDIEPFLSQNDNRLYFASNRPLHNTDESNDYNLWYSERQNGEWSSPVALDTIINTEGDEFYPSLSENGNLYFTASKPTGIGSEDIFMSKYINHSYMTPVVLDSAINTKTFEFNAYVSPKEDLLIFSSYGRKDDMGGSDLYYSVKNAQGNWKEAKNMGPTINSDKLDFCPFIDWERNNFYFTSERIISEESIISSVDELKASANRTLNGYGNIFRISLDELNLD